MSNISIVSDAIGLVVLAAEMGIAILASPSGNIPVAIWIAIYFVLAASAIYLWHKEDSPKSPVGWLGYVAASIVFGGLFFVCDVWVGHSKLPNPTLLDAAKHAGGPFGFVATLIVCPGLTSISIAGVARAYYLSKRNTEA